MALAVRPLFAAPFLLGLLLAIVLAFELLGSAPKLRGGPVGHVSPAPLAPPAVARARDTAAEAATADARPLFSSTRRPAQAATAATAASTAPRLSAIFIGGPVRTCVFDAGGHPLVVREGGHAGPYTVIAIAADRVTVTGAEGQRVLRPTMLPAGDAGTPGPVAANPVAPVPALQNLIARLRGLRGGGG